MWKFTFLIKSDVKTKNKDAIETEFLFAFC